MEEKTIDQSALANDVADKIPYEFVDYFLVKCLEPIKIKKEFSEPVAKQTTKDKNGIEAVDYDEVKTEVKEVDSDFRKGVVLKVPYTQVQMAKDSDAVRYTMPVSVGNIVVFRDRSTQYFDLLKDAKLVKYYDIIAVEK